MRMGWGKSHPLTGQSRTDSARCGAPLAHHPAPSPTCGEGVEGPDRGRGLVLDCGPVSGYGAYFRRNDGGVGAVNRAPTGVEVEGGV